MTLQAQDMGGDLKEHIILLLEWNRNSQMKLYISENMNSEKPELQMHCIYLDDKNNRS